MGDSLAQQIALAIAPKVGGAVSIFGSLWIFLEILGSREKQQQVYHRIMFMISTFDIMVSAGAFASTWPMTPATDPWKGRGTETTCTIQGFAMQLGGTLFTYNAALSIFYVLLITFKVNEIIIKKYEWAIHAPPLLFGLTTASVAAGMGWYHNANLWCWIAVDPDCLDEDFALENVSHCDRYQHIWIYRWALFFAPLWLCLVIQLACMVTVMVSVHRQEKQVEQYLYSSKSFSRLATATSQVHDSATHINIQLADLEGQPQPQQEQQQQQSISSDAQPNVPNTNETSPSPSDTAEHESTIPPPLKRTFSLRQSRADSFAGVADEQHLSHRRHRHREFRRTKQVATQAVLYIFAFYLTYFFATLNRILQQVNGSSPFGVLLMHSLTLPQQGFWNFLIYRRPYYLQLRRQSHTRWEAVKKAVVLSWFRDDK